MFGREHMAGRTTRVVHCKEAPYDVSVGRPSKWGNPFSHKSGTLAQHQVATREEAIAKHEQWIRTQPRLMAALHELKGKVLGCWCKPQVATVTCWPGWQMEVTSGESHHRRLSVHH